MGFLVYRQTATRQTRFNEVVEMRVKKFSGFNGNRGKNLYEGTNCIFINNTIHNIYQIATSMLNNRLQDLLAPEGTKILLVQQSPSFNKEVVLR